MYSKVISAKKRHAGLGQKPTTDILNSAKFGCSEENQSCSGGYPELMDSVWGMHVLACMHARRWVTCPHSGGPKAASCSFMWPPLGLGYFGTQRQKIPVIEKKYLTIQMEHSFELIYSFSYQLFSYSFRQSIPVSASMSYSALLVLIISFKKNKINFSNRFNN